MMRLMKTEIKKILKSKVNLVLLLCLFMFSGYRIYDVWTQATSISSALNYSYEDVDGNVIQGIDYLSFADEVHHEYASTLNEELIRKMTQDFEQIQHSYVRTTPDDAYMRYIYGDDYNTFLEKAKAGDYDMEELNDALGGKRVNGYSSEHDEKSYKAYFPYYYKEDRVLALYSQIFGNYYEFATTQDNLPSSDVSSLFITSLNKRVEDKKLSAGSGLFLQSEQFDPDVKSFYDQKYLDASYAYDSVIGNTMFVNMLYSLEFTSIVVLVLILSNTFAMEKYYKMDQIMVPSNQGWRKITMAKIGSGIGLAFAIVFVQCGMAFLCSALILPMRNLDMPYFLQAGISMHQNVAQYLFSYKEIIFSGILLMFLATIATSIITCICSYFTKNNFLCAVPLLLIVLITGSMQLFSLVIPGSFIDQFLPSQMVHFTQYFQVYEDVQNVVVMNSHIIALKDVVIIFWICAITVMLLVMNQISKRHTIKT